MEPRLSESKAAHLSSQPPVWRPAGWLAGRPGIDRPVGRPGAIGRPASLAAHSKLRLRPPPPPPPPDRGLIQAGGRAAGAALLAGQDE